MPRTQVALVRLCVEASALKQAVAAARRFGVLDSDFPRLERDYRRRSIGKMAARRQWGAAAGMAADDAELQARFTLPARQTPCHTKFMSDTLNRAYQ